MEEWLRGHVEPAGPVETAHVRPWATVSRVPLGDGVAWLKECGPVQAFEPRLTASLFGRWPDRVAEVIAHEDEQGWLLLADAGTPVGAIGNPPEAWLRALPRYAELQRGEAAHAAEHLRHGVPDLRLASLPARFDDLLARELPLGAEDVRRLRRLGGRLPAWCGELAACGVPETVQHDDLHMSNLYARDGSLRVLDWGDASVSHPFASLVVTFRFLEERNGLRPGNPWFARLRDAYMEPWGGGPREAFELAQRVGALAHAVASLRQRDHLPLQDVAGFDEDFRTVLRRAAAVA